MVGASGAKAHAFPDHTEPAVGSMIHDSPATVRIWFTRKLEPVLSTIQVLDSREQEVDRHDVKIAPDDPTLMVVSVPRLGAGTYKVVWQAVCTDGHTTHGDFTFEITCP